MVDDDPGLLEMLTVKLHHEGFVLDCCDRGDQALGRFQQAHPALVLLDLTLPGRDGLAVCRDIRAQSPVPIIMLTASCETTDLVAALEAGADDYVTKPFRTRELVARMKTRLRRHDIVDDPLLRIGDLTVDVDGHTVMRRGQVIPLTPLEFELLVALARRPGQVFSRADLLRQVWHFPEAHADSRLVNVHVQRLRYKIESDPEHPNIVLTVRGIGYKAVEASQVSG